VGIERLRFGMGENEMSVHGDFIRAGTSKDERGARRDRF
jgi:hypothetical protein